MTTSERPNAVELSSTKTEDAYCWKQTIDNGVVNMETIHRLEPVQPRIRKRPRSMVRPAMLYEDGISTNLAANSQRD